MTFTDEELLEGLRNIRAVLESIEAEKIRKMRSFLENFVYMPPDTLEGVTGEDMMENMP